MMMKKQYNTKNNEMYASDRQTDRDRYLVEKRSHEEGARAREYMYCVSARVSEKPIYMYVYTNFPMRVRSVTIIATSFYILVQFLFVKFNAPLCVCIYVFDVFLLFCISFFFLSQRNIEFRTHKIHYKLTKY